MEKRLPSARRTFSQTLIILLVLFGSSFRVDGIPGPVLLVHETCGNHHQHQPLQPLEGQSLTLERTEATVHDQLEITQLALSQKHGGEGLGLSSELVMAGGIAGEEVLEDTTVGRVGHCRYKRQLEERER